MANEEYISLFCPSCGQNLSAPPEFFGQSIACPACNVAVSVPIPAGAKGGAVAPSGSQGKRGGKGKVVAIGCAIVLLVVWAALKAIPDEAGVGAGTATQDASDGNGVPSSKTAPPPSAVGPPENVVRAGIDMMNHGYTHKEFRRGSTLVSGGTGGIPVGTLIYPIKVGDFPMPFYFSQDEFGDWMVGLEGMKPIAIDTSHPLREDTADSEAAGDESRETTEKVAESPPVKPSQVDLTVSGIHAAARNTINTFFGNEVSIGKILVVNAKKLKFQVLAEISMGDSRVHVSVILDKSLKPITEIEPVVGGDSILNSSVGAASPWKGEMAVGCLGKQRVKVGWPDEKPLAYYEDLFEKGRSKVTKIAREKVAASVEAAAPVGGDIPVRGNDSRNQTDELTEVAKAIREIQADIKVARKSAADGIVEKAKADESIANLQDEIATLRRNDTAKNEEHRAALAELEAGKQRDKELLAKADAERRTLAISKAKASLAGVESKIASEKKRWVDATGVINKLTNNKKTPVQEGTQAYYRCVEASNIIQEVEKGAADLKAEKAGLEAEIAVLKPAP